MGIFLALSTLFSNPVARAFFVRTQLNHDQETRYQPLFLKRLEAAWGFACFRSSSSNFWLMRGPFWIQCKYACGSTFCCSIMATTRIKFEALSKNMFKMGVGRKPIFELVSRNQTPLFSLTHFFTNLIASQFCRNPTIVCSVLYTISLRITCPYRIRFSPTSFRKTRMWLVGIALSFRRETMRKFLGIIS